MTKLISRAGNPVPPKTKFITRPKLLFAASDAAETRGIETRIHGHKLRKKREKIKI